MSSVMGALRAKKMQCGRAGLDGLPEKPPGVLGGRARDAVTPSWLARLSDSCHGIQLGAMNRWSYLRGLAFLSSRCNCCHSLQHRQGMETAAPSTY